MVGIFLCYVTRREGEGMIKRGCALTFKIYTVQQGCGQVKASIQQKLFIYLSLSEVDEQFKSILLWLYREVALFYYTDTE